MPTKRSSASTISAARTRREIALADLAELEVKALRERLARTSALPPQHAVNTAAARPGGDTPLPAVDPMPGSEESLDDVFSYHATTPADREAYEAIHRDAKHLARTIVANTPRCAEQSAAIRRVREAVMTANAARALKGLV